MNFVKLHCVRKRNFSGKSLFLTQGKLKKFYEIVFQHGSAQLKCTQNRIYLKRSKKLAAVVNKPSPTLYPDTDASSLLYKSLSAAKKKEIIQISKNKFLNKQKIKKSANEKTQHMEAYKSFIFNILYLLSINLLVLQ